MIYLSPTKRIAAIIGAIAAIALVCWAAVWFWNLVIEIDNSPPRSRLKTRMMHRKTVAMQDITDAVIQGDMRRVEQAADRMNQYGNTIQWYLSVALYRSHGEDFREATAEIKAAATARDVEAVKEATLRLERTCLECHILLNQQ